MYELWINRTVSACWNIHPKDAAAPLEIHPPRFSEIMFSPPRHTHMHTPSLSLRTTRSKKANMYSRCHHECQSTGDLFIYFGSITSVCLDLTQTSWSPLRACVRCKCEKICVRTQCASVITFFIANWSCQATVWKRSVKIYHLSLGLLFIVVYCFSCCSVSILPINLKQVNYLLLMK